MGGVLHLVSSAGLWAANVVLDITPYIVMSMLIIFVHELGHYTVGRMVGARIESFAVGFGKEVVGRTDRHGVRWSLRLFPLGGYVKFVGDADGSSRPDVKLLASITPQDRRSLLIGKSKLQRAAVLVAGPGANFLFAVVLLSGYFMAYGRDDVKPVVHTVVAGSAAAQAGFRAGDVITAVNGSKVVSLQDVKDAAQDAAGRPMLVTILRGPHHYEALLSAAPTQTVGLFGKETVFLIGFTSDTGPSSRILERFGPVDGTIQGADETWRIAYMSVASVANIMQGRTSMRTLSGPIKMVQVTGKMAHVAGIRGLFSLLAVISVSVGIINLLPIPVLDGGYLMMILVEFVLRRPVSDQAMEIFYKVGFVCLGSLAIVLTMNDMLSVLSGN
jgi:regulator of sigma E protease